MKKYRLLYGAHYQKVDGLMVKHVEGDIVELSDRQAVSFKDKFEPIGSFAIAPTATAIPKEAKPEEEKESKLKAVHKGFGKYDVVKVKTGEPINDKPLTKKEAYGLLESSDEPSETGEREGREDNKEEQAIEETKAPEDPEVDTTKDVAEPRRIPTRRRAKPKPSQSKTYSRKKIDSGK